MTRKARNYDASLPITRRITYSSPEKGVFYDYSSTASYTILRIREGLLSNNPPSRVGNVLWRTQSFYKIGSRTVNWHLPSASYRRISGDSKNKTVIETYSPAPFSNYVGRNEPLLVSSDLSPIYPTNSANRAMIQAAMKLQARSADLGTSMGEAKSTAASLAQNISSVVGAYNDFKRGKYKDMAKKLGIKPKAPNQTAASAWNSFQFGFAPLAADISDQIGAIKNGLPAPVVSARSTVTEHFSGFETPSSNGYKETRSATRRTKATYYAKVSNSFAYQLDQLGLLNPVSVGWNLTPYSFVVDWAIPIGNVLQVLTLPLTMDFVGGSLSVKVDSSITTLQPCTSTRDLELLGDAEPGCTTTYRGYYRHKLVSFPGMRNLYFKNPLSSSHVTSALALVTSVIGNRRS